MTSSVVDPEWMSQAACKGVNPDLFFPGSPGNHPPSEPMMAEAKAVCRSCPAIDDCLEVNLYERDGVWGGLGPLERRQLIRRRGLPRGVRKVCGVCGDPFHAPSIRGGAVIYCSAGCRLVAHAEAQRRHKGVLA